MFPSTQWNFLVAIAFSYIMNSSLGHLANIFGRDRGQAFMQTINLNEKIPGVWEDSIVP